MTLYCKCMNRECPHLHYADTLDDDDRCQPIGCDNGVHLEDCKYAKVDAEDRQWPPNTMETK
jgi:hypothetical protein